MEKQAVLLVVSRDRTGIVAALSDMVFRYGGNIIDADQHSDSESGMFFMRLAWALQGFSLGREGVGDALRVLSHGFEGMSWRLWYDEKPQKVALFCSKSPHCVYDLLLREAMGELGGEIAFIASNHDTLKPIGTHFDKPFFHIPVSSEDKDKATRDQLKLLNEFGVNLTVLARYMQIIPPAFIHEVGQDNIINIHHSFLPAFAGANPYRQAKERGVKVIGATAHYVTPELDAGPIIEQDVTRVSHRDAVHDMVSKGRDLERQVLSRAVRLHLQHRILVHGNRTVVFA